MSLTGAGTAAQARTVEALASFTVLADMVQRVSGDRVHTDSFKNSNDPRLVKQIGEATGAQPGGELYVEALSPAEGPAPTYADMFRYNVDRLVAGMKGRPKT